MSTILHTWSVFRARPFAVALMTLGLLLNTLYPVQAQHLLYRDVFRGGVSGDGYSPEINTPGTTFLKLEIAPESTIRRAYLLAGRHGNLDPVSGHIRNLRVRLAGHALEFNVSNQASPSFDSPTYGRHPDDPKQPDSIRHNSAVHAIDVTGILSAAVQNYRLDVPFQHTQPEHRYSDFYLYVAYENPTLPEIKTELYLNDRDFADFTTFSLNFPVPRCGDVALALFCGYVCSATDGSRIGLNGRELGLIGGADQGSGRCGGPVGSFHYVDGILSALGDDNPDEAMSGSDALSNVRDVLGDISGAVPLTIDGNNTNAIWAIMTAHRMYELLAPDTLVYLCRGSELVLDAGTGRPFYEWSTGERKRRITVQDTGTYSVSVPIQEPCRARRFFNVRYRELPPLLATQNPLDFGTLDGCTPFRDAELSLTNTGGEAIRIREFSIDGEGFSILNPPGTDVMLQPDENLSLTIRFESKDAIEARATLRAHSDICDSDYLFPLRARKEIYAARLDLPELQFGELNLCHNDRQDSVLRVRNNSAEHLEIRPETDTDVFKLISPRQAVVLAPGAVQEIVVEYHPDKDGEHKGRLLVPFSNSAGTCKATLVCPLAGTAVASRLDIGIRRLDFPPLLSCEKGIDTLISVRNSGNSELQIERVEADAALSVASDLPLVIPAGEERNLALRFSPPLGVHASVLSLIPGTCGEVLRLTVTGSREQALFIIPDSVDFGNIALCDKTDSTFTFTLRSLVPGNEGALLEKLDIAPPFFVSLVPGERLPNGEHEVRIHFRPDAPGSWSSTLALHFNTCEVVETVHLKGSYRESELWAPDILSFDNLSLSELRIQPAVFVNNGDKALRIESLEEPALPYSITGFEPKAPPLSLQPGDTFRVFVALRSERAGVFNERLGLFLGADPCPQTKSVALAATVDDAAQTVVQIPHIEAEVGQKDVVIPITFAGTRSPNFQGRSFELTLRMNGSLFETQTVQNATYSRSPINGSDEVLLRIKGSVNSAPVTGDVLTALRGRVLHAPVDFSTLRIVDFEWVDTEASVKRLDGSLTVTGICLPYGIQRFERTRILAMTPNPAENAVRLDLRIDRNGPTSLEIVSMLGQSIWSARWPAAGEHGENLKSITLPPNLAIGAYQVLLHSPGQYDMQRLQVIR